ncbi:TBC1 domain family member 10B [Rhinatrema bivittatum]|uniref:TBC1 domain family member 10B n=1 Tax=Rhinatrema bivittatum TaxID=194408 RepID=UPI00112E70B0|nr:TBC1 domain family member 10B [Rhinatrema bivittatum]
MQRGTGWGGKGGATNNLDAVPAPSRPPRPSRGDSTKRVPPLSQESPSRGSGSDVSPVGDDLSRDLINVIPQRALQNSGATGTVSTWVSQDEERGVPPNASSQISIVTSTTRSIKSQDDAIDVRLPSESQDVEMKSLVNVSPTRSMVVTGVTPVGFQEVATSNSALKYNAEVHVVTGPEVMQYSSEIQPLVEFTSPKNGSESRPSMELASPKSGSESQRLIELASLKSGSESHPPVEPTSPKPCSTDIQTQPSLLSDVQPLVVPSSPQHNFASKPPLPGGLGPQDYNHPRSPSSSSVQYHIAPKSSLYSSLCPAATTELVVDSGSLPVLGGAGHPTLRHVMGSLSSLGPGIPAPRSQPPAPDTLSYLDSVSMMSGTLESLTHLDDTSSLGSDSEINGLAYRKTDKYGFLGGSQFSSGMENLVAVDISRQRELKWLDMFSHWDKWLVRRFQKVKLRCRKGIPSSLRAKAWQFLSNSKELLEKNPGKFEELERCPGEPKWLDVIEKDLHRQFPFHEMFAARGGHGQQDLYRILKAYTIYRPDEGYCQAQAPVAAVLLMHMPAEQAFWCLVQICEKYLPGYYSAGLEAIQLDGEIFFALLRRVSPMAYRHLKKYKIDPILYMTEWFMCIFSRTLPWASVLRVWDMFFCEGVKIIFRVGLVLLRHTLGSVDKLRSCQGMYETMEKLRNLPTQYMQEDFLIHEITSLPVTEALIERENTTQLKKWRESRGELQHKPSRRLHGCHAVYEESRRINPPLAASSSLLSLTGLRRASKEDRWREKGPRNASGITPASSTGNLPGSAAPAPISVVSVSSIAPLEEEKDAQPRKGPVLGSQVVSEGLYPALPSPTGTVTPLGDPKKSKEERKKEKELEKQQAKDLEKQRERAREQEKLLEKQRAREQKEREKQEREREKRLQKERVKEVAKQKREKKTSFRKKESPPQNPQKELDEKGTGDISITSSEKRKAAVEAVSENRPSASAVPGDAYI